MNPSQTIGKLSESEIILRVVSRGTELYEAIIHLEEIFEFNLIYCDECDKMVERVMRAIREQVTSK